MSTTQAFLLGAMMAWTPTLIILAWLLRDAPTVEDPTVEDEITKLI
jgi:hypothetical protein